MISSIELDLDSHKTPDSLVERREQDVWHLEISPGQAGKYRLAQLDDYRATSRRALPWHPPLTISLRARASSAEIEGTWGFGLWNDPFGLSLGFGGANRRLPALPNAAWFFFASPPNYLSLRDDQPAQGFLAATFRSWSLPAVILALGLPALPLLLWPLTARWLRPLGRGVVHQDALALDLNPTNWHRYCLEWGLERVIFSVDDKVVFETPVVPRGPLGLVLWVDNQYAAYPPDGRLAYGTLTTSEPAWLQIGDLILTAGG
ncbi:MAG: hypothetical protein PVG14_06775 [Anaerolineales bacterium]